MRVTTESACGKPTGAAKLRAQIPNGKFPRERGSDVSLHLSYVVAADRFTVRKFKWDSGIMEQ